MNLQPVPVWRNAICDDRTLTSSQKLVALVLSRWMSRTGFTYPSKTTIAESASLSVRTVDAAVDQLEQAGYLRIERSKGHTSWRYNATIEGLDVAMAATSTAQQVPRNGATAATSNVATDAPNVATDDVNVATTATESDEVAESVTTALHWERAVAYVNTTGSQLQPAALLDELVTRYPNLTDQQIHDLLLPSTTE